MPAVDRRTSLVRRTVQWIADSDSVRSFAIPFMHRLDGWILEASGGSVSATEVCLGIPIVTLTTTGAKSGQERSSILTGIPDGGSTVVIASNFGQDHYPSWYYNLKANPEAMLSTGGRPPEPHHATVLGGSEWDRVWDLVVWSYPGYASYRERTDRPIPLVRLVPSG